MREGLERRSNQSVTATCAVLSKDATLKPPAQRESAFVKRAAMF